MQARGGIPLHRLKRLCGMIQPSKAQETTQTICRLKGDRQIHKIFYHHNVNKKERGSQNENKVC